MFLSTGSKSTIKGALFLIQGGTSGAGIADIGASWGDIISACLQLMAQ